MSINMVKEMFLKALPHKRNLLITLSVLFILLACIFVSQTHKQTPHTNTTAAPISHFMQNASPLLVKGISIPSEHFSNERDKALVKLSKLFVESNVKYLTATNTKDIQGYFLENTERLFAYNNYQIVLKLSESPTPLKGVWILPVSENRTELLYYISRPIVVDLVDENGVTKLDYLTPIRDCEQRNETLHNSTGITLDCAQYSKMLINAAKAI